jgi:DnaK suppressor protein
MTDARYEKLQQTLDARLCEFERELDLKLRAGRANNGYSGEMRAGLDTAETADADLQQDLGIAVLEMKVAALRGARDALVRFASGAYGYCAECGGEISEKRLKAFPFAVRCRECEEVCEISAGAGGRAPPTRRAPRRTRPSTASRHGSIGSSHSPGARPTGEPSPAHSRLARRRR